MLKKQAKLTTIPFRDMYRYQGPQISKGHDYPGGHHCGHLRWMERGIIRKCREGTSKELAEFQFLDLGQV